MVGTILETLPSHVLRTLLLSGIVVMVYSSLDETRASHVLTTHLLFGIEIVALTIVALHRATVWKSDLSLHILCTPTVQSNVLSILYLSLPIAEIAGELGMVTVDVLHRLYDLVVWPTLDCSVEDS